MVGGPSLEESPLYVRLVSRDDGEQYVERREGGLEGFLQGEWIPLAKLQPLVAQRHLLSSCAQPLLLLGYRWRESRGKAPGPPCVTRGGCAMTLGERIVHYLSLIHIYREGHVPGDRGGDPGFPERARKEVNRNGARCGWRRPVFCCLSAAPL